MRIETRLSKLEATLDPPKTRLRVWWVDPRDPVGISGAVKVRITPPDPNDHSPLRAPVLAFQWPAPA